MSTIQVKTVERLIIRELHGADGYNEKAHSAFTKVLRHFSDEEYLYGIGHTEIIKKIYIQNFYKYHSAEALSREQHIDVKTLLFYRKAYVHLFAKFYLGLTASSKADMVSLYERLKEDESAAERQDRSRSLPKTPPKT